MAVNWQDPNQVKTWREQAIKQWSPEEVDAVIQEETQKVYQTQPKVDVSPQVTPRKPDLLEQFVEGKDENLVQKISGGIARGVTALPRVVLEAGRLGYNKLASPEFHEISAKIDSGKATDEELQRFIEMNSGKWLKDKEVEQASGDIGKGALLGGKKAISTGAYLIPGAGAGGTVTQGAIQGTKVGAMTGFGAEQDELSLGGSLAGGVVGGIIGGITGGISQAIGNKIRATRETKRTMTTGEKMRAGVSKPEVGAKKTGPFYAEKTAEIQRVPDEVEKVTGIKIAGSPDRQLTNTGPAFRDLDSKIRSGLDITDDIKYGKAFSNFDDEVSKTNWMDDRKVYDTAKEELKKRLSKELSKGGKMSVNAYDLKSDLRGELDNVFTRLKSGSSKLSPSEEVKFALYSSLKKTIDGVSIQVGKYNTLQHGLYDYSDGLIKASQEQGLKIPWADLRWKFPANVIDEMRDFAGRNMFNLGQPASNIMTQIPPELSNIPAIVASDTVAKGIGGPQELPDLENGEDLSTMEVKTTDVTPKEPDAITLPTGQKITREKLFELRMKNINNPKASKFLNTIEAEFNRMDADTTGKAIPAGQAEELADFDSSVAVLDEVQTLLSENPQMFGTIKGALGKANPWNIEARSADATLRRAAQIVGRAMEGGVLRKEDEEKYYKMLSQLTDQPEIAQNKLDAVKEMIIRNRQARIDALEAAGYSPRKGISLDEITQ